MVRDLVQSIKEDQKLPGLVRANMLIGVAFSKTIPNDLLDWIVNKSEELGLTSFSKKFMMSSRSFVHAILQQVYSSQDLIKCAKYVKKCVKTCLGRVHGRDPAMDNP